MTAPDCVKEVVLIDGGRSTVAEAYTDQNRTRDIHREAGKRVGHASGRFPSKVCYIVGECLFLPRGRHTSADAAAVCSPSTSPIVAAAIAPSKMPVRHTAIDVNDMRVCYAHVHRGVLREKARLVGVELKGQFLPRTGCSTAKEIGRPVPMIISCRSAYPINKVFVGLWGPRLPKSGGGARYIMLITEDHSRSAGRICVGCAGTRIQLWVVPCYWCGFTRVS